MNIDLHSRRAQVLVEISNEIDFNLVKGGAITGKVTNAFNGSIVESAYVLATSIEGIVIS